MNERFSNAEGNNLEELNWPELEEFVKKSDPKEGVDLFLKKVRKLEAQFTVEGKKFDRSDPEIRKQIDVLLHQTILEWKERQGK